jgi:hypothetical protein
MSRYDVLISLGGEAMRASTNSKNMTGRYGPELRDFALFVPTEAGALAAWARRVLVVGLIVLLCFVSVGLIDPRTTAQEVAGHHRWRVAMEPALHLNVPG